MGPTTAQPMPLQEGLNYSLRWLAWEALDRSPVAICMLFMICKQSKKEGCN
jgi:hypothetical protein